MRPLLLAVCLAVLVAFFPTSGRTAPLGPATAPAPVTSERVVMDAVFWAIPGPVSDTCLQFPPGHLAVAVRLEPVGMSQPVHFWFSPYWVRAADTGADIHAPVTRDSSIFEATLAGGRYCYALTIDPPGLATAGENDGDQAQLVSLKMTFMPTQ